MKAVLVALTLALFSVGTIVAHAADEVAPKHHKALKVAKKAKKSTSKTETTTNADGSKAESKTETKTEDTKTEAPKN